MLRIITFILEVTVTLLQVKLCNTLASACRSERYGISRYYPNGQVYVYGTYHDNSDLCYVLWDAHVGYNIYCHVLIEKESKQVVSVKFSAG